MLGIVNRFNFPCIYERGLRVAVDAAGAADVYYVPRLPVLDAEVWGCGSDELEWCGVVQRDNRLPLFVRHLHGIIILVSFTSSVLWCFFITDFMDYSVPGEPGVVDNDVYLAVAELDCLLH